MKVMEPQDMNAAFEEAYNSGEIERLMELYEPDAMMAPSPGKRAVGHTAIREVRGGPQGLDRPATNLRCTVLVVSHK